MQINDGVLEELLECASCDHIKKHSCEYYDPSDCDYFLQHFTEEMTRLREQYYFFREHKVLPIIIKGGSSYGE